MARIVVYLLMLYQKMNLLPGNCRFSPTCSEYAIQSLGKYGLIKGGYLALKRLIRCNQFFPGGLDPIK